ncbi:MAG TPA: TonB-dependent receptor [Paracoccus solventivorans]|uniref:TonB-dependent receptor domain-containing protein n=1 Tax=Paracoccus solventivorans TaxID=53463 RepID=UPI002CC6EECF|nr:TonB-dependent receptor [Paracoccus solventivorans]HMM07826.1 TonB-dependent receptor [Paracoccus solventivorans]
MLIHRLLPLAGVSTLALVQSAAFAQEPAAGAPIVLAPITLVADGEENIEATGGVVVTREDIEALQPTDPSELFARESAVTVSGGAGPSKRIHVFGMEQSNLAVTVDGVPQFGNGWHHTGSNVIDPAFLKSVEIEAGAAAADAGFAASAGALRYETLGARDMLTDGRTTGGRAALSYGSNGRGVAGSLAGYGVYEGFDYFAMIHAADGDNYENGDGYEILGSKPAAEGALLKLGYEFDSHRIELAYEFNRDEADRVAKMNMDLGAGDAIPFPLKVTRSTLSLKYTTTAPTDTWDPVALLYVGRSEYWRPNHYPAPRTNGDMILDAQTIGGVLKNTFTLEQGTITAGVDWAYDDYRVDNYGDRGPAFAVRTLETMQLGAFVQGRFEFDNGIDLSTGLRFDHQRFTDWNGERHTDSGASVNGTVAYEFAEGYEVFAGASRTWSGYDIGQYAYLHARDAIVVADDFEPATARNVKAGLNASQGNWTGNITFFDTRLKNLSNDYVPSLANTAEYRSKGYTLQGNYSWGLGRVGASFTDADVTQNGVNVLPAGGTVVPVGKLATLFVDQEIPQYNLKVGGTIEWSGKLSTAEMQAAGFEDHNSYTVVNVYGEWRPQNYQNVAVHLNVDNLLDETYYERSSYVQGGPRDVGPLYAPGRTVTLGVKMDF